MTEIVIRDVPIRFPFEPYKVQEEYMSKVLECLQQGVNGVLESPTGTGKTLSLLCSSLAWLQTKKAHLQASAQGTLFGNDKQQSFTKDLQAQLQKSAGNSDSADSTWSQRLAMPQIIYASRTHAQLTQVMKELKRTSYAHVKAAVLGSRDQLCIHPDLSQEQGMMKVTLCRAKVKARTCHYSNNLDARKHEQSFLPTDVMDIEDLVKLGNKNQCCPYYLAREMANSGDTDIVFMPYNYLLNPQTRQIQRINLNNAVVLLDEAHNVERMCEESASVRITSTDIAVCIAEVTKVMKRYSEDVSREFNEGEEKDFSMEDLCVLKTMFLSLEAAVDEIQLETLSQCSNEKQKNGKTFPGSYIFELLAKAEIKAEKIPVIDNALSSIAEFLTTTSDSSPLSEKGSMLLHFSEFLKVVFASCGDERDQGQSDLFYKVYVEPESLKKNKGDFWSTTKTAISTTAKAINFWCFSPGFAMRSLMKQGVHCVILTSGTLSPLQATISELGIPIPVQLENPHIIESSQLSVNVLCQGPSGERFLSSYVNRENLKYYQDLGRMLINFCHIIPGGILMFFPSYPTMEKTVNIWKEEGIWSTINASKLVFVEQQRRDSLVDMMREYTTALEAEGSHGAVFLAVMRGKVSEGMDFSDANCRAVLVTGLPFPPFMDPRVMLKQEYCDKKRTTDRNALSGRDWYNLEASRAVNQAVGRVIRHANDFGVILLCDHRFEKPWVSSTLSTWLIPHIVACKDFGRAYARVRNFFRAIGMNPPSQPVQSGASFDYVEGKVRTKEPAEGKSQKENDQASLNQFLERVRTMQPKASPTPSPLGLLDALSVSTNQKKAIDVLKAVYVQPDEVKELSSVQPEPKRRKIKIMPLRFDSASDSSATATTSKSMSSAEYCREVQNRLEREKFQLFRNAVKEYASSTEFPYDKIVLCLRKVFPDASFKDLFIGFKRYIKKEHMQQFENLCFSLFNSTT